MASHGRKRKPPARVAAPLEGEALARAILALPPQPQPIRCRVEGCLEPLAPGYHKKCGRFHDLDVFETDLRSCRHSLARHQERRKRRKAHPASGAPKTKPAQPGSTAEEEQARDGEQQQQSQLGGAEREAQPQPEPLPVPLPEGEAAQLTEQAATPKPRQPASPDKQQRRRRAAGGKRPRGHAIKARAASLGPTAEQQLLAEQPSLPAEQSPPELHSAKRPRLTLPPEAPPAASTQQAQQAQQADPLPPVTPPGKPGSQVGSRSLMMAEPASPMCAPLYAVPAQRSLLPALQEAAAAPAPASWGQQAPSSPSAAAWGYQQAPPSPAAAACGQQAPAMPSSAAWVQQMPPAPADTAWGQQPPASPSAAAWAAAPADAAWGRQLPAMPADAAWGRQLPAAPAAATWGQQPAEGSWLLIIGDQRLSPVQPPLIHQQHLMPVAACEMQQPAGQVFWPAQQAQHARSASGGGCSSATYYPCYELAAVQEPQMRSSFMLEALPCSPFLEMAACSAVCGGGSASTPAGPLSARMGPAPHSLPPCGSATAMDYTTAPSLPPPYGGSLSTPQRTAFYTANAAAAPTSPSFWAGAGVPAAPVQPQPASLPPEGCTGSSSALHQTWGQLCWQDEERQLTPRAVATPRAAALPPSQPSLQPSPRATVQSTPCAELPPNLLPSRLPSLRLPQAPPANQQAQQWQQCWEAGWADESLIPSPLSCPPSPAVSWLAGFS